MKANFDYQFVNENGNPVKFNGRNANLKDISVAALLNAASQRNEKGETMEPGAREKRHRFDLAAKIRTFGSQAELTSEDVELLKACIGEGYHTMVAAPAAYILEGKEPPAIMFKQDEPDQPAGEPAKA